MRKILWNMLMLALTLAACSDEDMVSVAPTEKGIVTDSDGNEYEWVRIGGQDWTTSNAKNGPSCAEATYLWNGYPSYVFEGEEVVFMEETYMPEYGNLMTFEDAMVSAPEGWRLPTDEDWKRLEQTLGMGSDAGRTGWRGKDVGTLMMQKGEGTRLNLQLGGAILWTASYYLYLDFLHFKEYGYYWTSTVEPSYTDFQAAYYRKLCFGRGGVERQAAKTTRLMSVRWVRDAQ